MSSSPAPSPPERPLSATRLAQYATARGRCERYLRLALFPSEGEALMRARRCASGRRARGDCSP